jgi:hypothetical protein
MPVQKVVIDPQPQIRVTQHANAHIEKVIRARKKLGLVVSKTSLTSEAILAIPLIPNNGNGSHPVAEAERKLLNQEAHP